VNARSLNQQKNSVEALPGNSQVAAESPFDARKRILPVQAVKTGLPGHAVLLSPEEAALHQQHVQSFFTQHKPEGDRQSELVQRLADTQWRLIRIPGLEMGIFARGRALFAEKFADYDEQTASMLIQAEVLVVNQKELRNLHLEERRLRRQYEEDLHQLGQLETQHMFDQLAERRTAAQAKKAAPRKRAREAANGFQFFEKLNHLERKIQNLSAEQLNKEMDGLEALFPYPEKAA
jgi:hypothetical protein